MSTNIELAHQDLVYFGYSYGEDDKQNRKFQSDFISEIKERFPHVELKDSYDDIKGYRQTVYLHKEDNDNYYSWLIGKGWFEMSLTLQLIMMSSGNEPEQKEKFDKYFQLAKIQYPEAFKSTQK